MAALEQFSLKGKRALITGSSAGIGLALASGMAEAGASVIINGRTSEKVAAAAAPLLAAGHNVHEKTFDVIDAAAVDQAISEIEADIGGIDILVNNAGIQRRGALEDFPVETWRELMSTNLDGVFYAAKAVAQKMKTRGSGSIINICSVQSELGRPTIAPYTASKGAVKMLTKGMAIDWGQHGIRVNGLGPGYFATELNEALVADEKFSAWLCDRTPLGRWGEVDELVGAAVFLASDAASFVTGHVLYVDGGVTARL
ncbi:MAG: glucose 1-dehydrogenase [Pseudomonadota bacterium]